MMLTHDQSNDLARRAAAGDAQAFTEIFEAFRPLIESTAARRTKHRDDRDDLFGELQIVFCKAVHQYGDSDRGGHFAGLVKVAVEAAAGQWLRFRHRSKRHGNFSVVDPTESAPRAASTPSPLQILIDREAVDQALDSLVRRCPEVEPLVPHLKAGFNLREAAATEGLDDADVKHAVGLLHKVKRRRRRVQTVIGGETRTFESMAEASRVTGVPVPSIHWAIANRKQGGGLWWRDADRNVSRLDLLAGTEKHAA